MTPLSIAAEPLADALRNAGWCHLPQALDPALTAALRADLAAQRDRLTPAAVGRAGARQRMASVRNDETAWLSGSTPAQQTLLTGMASLRFALNRELLLGLFDYEAHYAVYPPGGFYRRHVDAFNGRSIRVLSTVFYLNEAWQAADGGELVIWGSPLFGSEGREVACLMPRAGDAVFFLSAEFPHEVRPAHRERCSVAGWFRVNGSTGERADPPR